jgi:hypothetical protein
MKIPSTFTTSVTNDTHEYVSVLFEHLALAEGLVHRYRLNRSGRQDATPALLPWPIVTDVLFSDFSESILRHPNGSILVFGFGTVSKTFTVTVAAETHALRDEVIKDVDALLPARQPSPDREEVNIQFWTLGANGQARSMTRTIGVANWPALRDNYTPQTLGGLDTLMDSAFRPNKAGQLMLWYGPPGTGKTHALRALAWEWRKWCTYHYIVDPEVFFGGNANYMLDVLLNRDSSPSFSHSEDDDESERDTPPKKEPKWRLLILEDSGELMVPDAKAQTGQGLSRLLNVVDGLIGQGLRIMVLVTTNEILKKLHPAVARPGRCAARIEFGEFTKQDAGLWLAKHDHDVASGALALNTTVPLAELFGIIGDEQTISEARALPVGFA